MPAVAPSVDGAPATVGLTRRSACYAPAAWAPAGATAATGGRGATGPGIAAGGAPSAQLRVSDVDRERVVDRLCAAAGEGRLTLAEVADRQAVAYAARFSGELNALLVDLPAEEPEAPPRRTGHAGGALLRDALRTILVINAIALCVGLSAIPGTAGVVALLSGITIMLAVAAVEVVRREHHGERPAPTRARR
jgi:Domain of unknown function (DUF1707)